MARGHAAEVCNNDFFNFYIYFKLLERTFRQSGLCRDQTTQIHVKFVPASGLILKIGNYSQCR